MKYAVQIFAGVIALAGIGTPVHSAELEAENDHEAVDAARETHDVPDEGGDFSVVVLALEVGPNVKTWSDTKKDFVEAPRPIGEICRFGVKHEPAAHLREALEAAAAEEKALADAAALKEQHRQELLAELGITAEQAATMKVVSK